MSEAACDRHKKKQSKRSINKSHLSLVNLSRISSTSYGWMEDTFSDARVAGELLGYPHRITVQFLRQVRAKRCACRGVQVTRIEFLDDPGNVGLLFRRPFASSKGGAILGSGQRLGCE